MKKIYTTIILFLLAQIPIKIIAQCNPAIPNNTNVVDSTQTVNGGFTPQWVCKDDTLFSGGGIFFVYLEPGAVMSTGGGIDSIYVKNGATLIMNGGIHVILHEPAAILNVAGGIPTYFPCPSIIFDYTNAPVDGCFITSINEALHHQHNIVEIFPNPFTKEIFLKTSGKNPTAFIIKNILGQTVCTEKSEIRNLESEMKLDLEFLPQGIYFAEINFGEERMVRKIVKE